MKKILSLLLVLVLLCGLTACSGTKNDPATEPTETPTTNVTAPVVPDGYNLLTGEYSVEKGQSSRPVGVMIANDSATIGKQMGVDKAHIIVETETEGSIPRMMAVFANAESVPAKLGPIRSARSPFVATARALGVVYCHAGGSDPAKATLATNVLDHFDALADGKTFWRDDQLKNAIDFVHSVATSGEALKAKLDKSKYSAEATKDIPFSFGEAKGTGLGTTVQLKTTASHTVTFKYDAEAKVYSKNIGKIDSCKPHKTLDGKALTFSNVLVLYAEKYSENGTTYNFRTGVGSGYLISGGTSREIKYNRADDALSITETDGSKALLATGKTYIFIVDQVLKENVIFQ